MKIFILIIMAIFYSCTSPYDPTNNDTPKNVSGVIGITGIEQSYYSTSSNYSSVKISYNVTNTGDAEIDYYKIYFEVTCTDGSKYTEWDNGSSVPVNGYLSDYTYVSTSEKQYSNVVVTKKEFKSY